MQKKKQNEKSKKKMSEDSKDKKKFKKSVRGDRIEV